LPLNKGENGPIMKLKKPEAVAMTSHMLVFTLEVGILRK